MAPPNLTREQAAERAAILSVDNYRIELDLTDGAGAPGTTTFRSITTVTFGATEGASTFIDLIAQKVNSATLNGSSLDVSGYTEDTGLALTGLSDILRARNITQPGGQFEITGKSLAIAPSGEFHSEEDIGGVLINETPTFRADQMPYGGVKESGNTKEGPHYAVREMTEERLVVISLGV